MGRHTFTQKFLPLALAAQTAQPKREKDGNRHRGKSAHHHRRQQWWWWWHSIHTEDCNQRFEEPHR